VTWRVVRQQVVNERFKLRLSAVRSEDGLVLEFHYDASRLTRAAVERIAGYFETLLAAAVAAAETPVSRLPLLNRAERERIVVEWNQTAAEYPRNRCFHELFEAQAARTPDRPAVRFNHRLLSYRELNQQANQLAHYLRRQGVGPDSLVGLCLERSAEMMVALLAVLKAGGAYVPLNPDNPKPRLAQQLSGAVALITEQKLMAQMPEFSGALVCLDRAQTLSASEPDTNPEVNTTPENLVYVIYTSGSTGVPKGVAVRHGNLVNYTHFITRRLELERHLAGLHFATVSTIGADLGNTCIYPALASGGCLHVISYEVSTDAQRFAEYCEKYPLDVLKIVPSHLAALLHSAEAKWFLPRKFLITGGEPLTAKLVERVGELGASCEILNHYGPTETTVGSLTLRLTEYDWKNSTTIPIGRPVANTQVYILDAELQPVPVGVIGELYIAGAGVTAGYLNQPERTAERFLQNPFVDDAEAKMYRTGDVARYDEQGRVEFLGRGDDQVKIRGFRIELGEIEAVLGKHTAVKQAVVLAKEDEHGDKLLLAYVVAHRHHTISSDELKTHLQQQLPDYMVPSAIVFLSKIPLTANGKIDRQALPAPEQMQAKVYVAPRNETEQAVAKIWAEVLRRDRISVDDNFFDLGGHSLLATQVISRLRRELNIELPLRTMFESTTAAKLSDYIAQSRKSKPTPVAPPITRVSRDLPLPLSFAQQRLWVLDQLQPNNPLYNIPRAIRMKGKLNVTALERALNEIVRRHESQRTTFSVVNREPVQVIAPSLTIVVPVHDLTSLPPDQRETVARQIAAQEAQQPFDLRKGPLVRAALIRIGEDDHVLLLTMHHIVSDAWSAGVFVTELSDLYQAFAGGKPSLLKELPIQYADYAAWQRNWLRGEVLDGQLKYWREQLKGAPPVVELPSDHPRPAVQSFHGALETVPLAGDVSRAVAAFSQEHGATVFMTLLAGFQAMLARHSGQEQIVVGTDLANRATIETERLIGFFINVLPLKTDLSGNPTFTELLSRVREVALGAYAHQDTPFDKLVEELQPERNLSHNPLVQVLFVMQNIPRQRRELAGLTLEPFAMPLAWSKFDLAVFMVDEGQRLVSHWLYSTDLFERSTILRLAANFETLLGHAVASPETRLSALEMVSNTEKERQNQEKKERKHSQLKKLMTAEPKAFSVSSGDDGGNK
jgi:amino acid adenylation domain-containing protein